MNNSKNILITGAYGGLATPLIQLLVKENYYVYATDANEKILEKYKNEKNIHPIVIDITSEENVQNAFIEIETITSTLDAIIHIAGKLVVGSLVEIEEAQLKSILEVNFLGVYRVNKQFSPLLLEKKGRIIIMSSETGKQTAAPFNGPYALSKYALEAYSDSLRRELSFLGISVVKIRPGAFKTEMTKHVESLFLEAEKKSKLFKKQLTKGRGYLPKVYKNANDPKLIAKKIGSILKAKNPKTVYTIKADPLRTFLEFLPTKWADFLIKKGLS